MMCVLLQGGIDSGGHENPMSAAVRELKEETGISSARIVALVSTSNSVVHRACVDQLQQHADGLTPS